MKNIGKKTIIGLLTIMLATVCIPKVAEAASWMQNSVGWWWQEDDGSYPADEWKTINGKRYYFDKQGYMKTGWFWDGQNWYYFGDANDGAMKTGWCKVGNAWYYMYMSGKMASNTWIGSDWVNQDGVWVPGEMPNHWIQVGNRWWYRHTGGGYTANDWELINGQWYHFDANGWMQHGWLQVDGNWYYLGTANDGVMRANQWIGDYYVDETGKWDTTKTAADREAEYYEKCKQDMLTRVNQERAKAGLSALELYEPINETAQIKAEDLYETGVFDHYSANLGYFYDQFNKIGLKYTAGGENIAYGYSSVDSVMIGWMNSEGHRANILGEYYTHLGVGYYKGYWVQQFVAEPKLAESVECPRCDGVINVDEYSYTSKDAEGNVYGIYQCKSCAKMLEKCPKCETGFFEAAGITINGSTASRCDECGHNQTATCIEFCPSCDAKVLNNIKGVSYKVTFDSTKTWDGEVYEKTKGCYFQQMIISSYVCNSCGKHIKGDALMNYEDAYEKLRTNLGSEEVIFDYIFWEKKIGTELVEELENGAVYRTIYEFIDTPKITRTSDLIGEDEF